MCKLIWRVYWTQHTHYFMGEKTYSFSHSFFRIPSLFLLCAIRVVVWIHTIHIYVFIYWYTSIKWCAQTYTHTYSVIQSHRQHKEGKKEIKKINQTKANEIHSTFKTQKEIHILWWCELKCSITKENIIYYFTLVVKEEKKINRHFVFLSNIFSISKRIKKKQRKKFITREK